MFKKTMAAAGCMAVVAAGWAYAATNWQLQAKLNTAGGKLQVRDKAVQTVAGTVGYYNFTTSALIPVQITANTGYEISSVKKGTVAQTITDKQTFNTTVDKTGGLLQSVQASFIVKQSVVTGAVVGSGTITPTSAKVPYNGTIIFSSNPATTGSVLNSVTAGAVVTDAATGTPVTLPYGKPVKITLSNVQAPQTVTATYGSVAVSAGADKVIGLGVASTIYGSISAGDTISWAMVSGPVAVDTSSWTTAKPVFTPTVAGTYVFKATEGLAGLSDTVEVVATADTNAYMKNACDGCHNATSGVLPSAAFGKWTSSKHADSGVTCISCHTDGAMPTPVNSVTVEADTFKVLNSSAGTVGANYCAKCHSTVSHITAVAPNNTCTRCHTGGQHNPATFFGYFDPAIATAHVFGIATPSAGASVDGQAQTQYVTQGATCDDCHATHGETPQNVSFAESGHGKTSNAALNAFVHYDWSGRTNNGTRQNGNCDRCHTAGGFLKLLGDDPALTARLTPVTGQANNVLVCVACHNDLAAGGLRLAATPAGNGQTLAQGYFALFSSAGSAVPVGKTKIQVAFPGMKNSSICIPCHSGRSTDDVFVAVIDRANADLKNYTTIQTGYYQHAANMAQGFIGKGAFNFNGGEYAGANGHMAVKNGASDTQGPCVGCHYSKDGADHSLEPVGFTAVCQSCHAAPFGATDVEAKKEEYEAGLAVLTALIHEKFDGLRATTNSLETERQNVRFGRFNKPAGTAADAATAKLAYGAWYNWQLLTVWDRAMFAHNPTLARTVLMDTIDFLDSTDNKLNGSAAATIAASTAVTAEQAAAAAEFVETPACASCHATQTTLVQGGKHAAEVSTHSGSCGRCHTTEGYVAFLASANGANPAGSFSSTSYNGSQNVSCAACHDEHGTLRQVAWAPTYGSDVNGVATSNQFKLCTSCHNLVNASGIPVASGNTVSGTATASKQQHNKDWYRNVASTHYDLPSTGLLYNGTADVTVGTSTVIEGYNVRWNKESACTDCHGHELYTNTGGAIANPPTAGTIHTDWAQSGHAGGLLKAKFDVFTTANPTRSRNVTNAAAVMAAGVTGTSGPAWEHYNWDRTGRQGCQKCHTATGAANFLKAVADFNNGVTGTVAYNAANNDFSHLKGWATGQTNGSPQNEVLYCWGCHTSVEKGEVVQTGAMPAEYKFDGATVNGTFPNVGSSNLCVSCHGGRASGQTVKDRTDLAAGQLKSFTNSHYLAAGGTLFKSVGYEYAGRTYVNSSSFKHDKLGTAALTGYNLGNSGPCVTCHLGNKANGGVAKFDHKFKVAGFQGGTCGTGSVAGACHATMTQAELDTEKEDFEASLDALNVLLKDKGFTWGPASPYFANADWTKNGTVDGKMMLGAGFNLNYLLHEPGAYAHNRYYTKRMIIDSIDFVYNATLEPLTSYVGADTKTYYAGSDIEAAIDYAVGKTYADHNGVVQTFTAEQAAIVKTYLDADTATAGMQRR